MINSQNMRTPAAQPPSNSADRRTTEALRQPTVVLGGNHAGHARTHNHTHVGWAGGVGRGRGTEAEDEHWNGDGLEGRRFGAHLDLDARLDITRCAEELLNYEYDPAVSTWHSVSNDASNDASSSASSYQAPSFEVQGDEQSSRSCGYTSADEAKPFCFDEEEATDTTTGQ